MRIGNLAATALLVAGLANGAAAQAGGPFAAVQGGVSVTAQDDCGHSITTTGRVVVGGTATGNIHEVADQDWFRGGAGGQQDLPDRPHGPELGTGRAARSLAVRHP